MFLAGVVSTDKYFEETFDLGYRLGVAVKEGGD